MSYENLSKEQLIEVLKRRDAEAHTPYGLRWERKGITPDKALNNDFVGFSTEKDLSCGDAPWQHLVIEGDNFDALRNLASVYSGQVKLIYIDPPYNTGRKDFVYNDSFFDATDRYRHSTWLEFMYQRLMLARELLAPNGAIFVSIDDNELFNLGLLMSQVFGENNFIANVIWQKVYSPKNTAPHFSDDHEYVLVYAANKSQLKVNQLPRTAEQDKAYKNPDKDKRGVWKASDLTARNYYGEGKYSLTCPSGRHISGPPPGRYWSVSKSRLEELDRDNRIWWGKDGNNIPALKRFLSEVKQGVVPQTLWFYDEVGHTQDAKKQLNEILPKARNEEVFSTPKPLGLMDRILRLASDPGDLVLDFFAGSGTFGQAVLALNAEGKGDRRFILVSSSEATQDAPDRNLCRDVCAARLSAAVAGYTTEKGTAVPGLGGGFAYLKTHRVPLHRLQEGLNDQMVWNYALMSSGHPVTPYAGPIATSYRERDRDLVIYCADTKRKTLTALQSLVASHNGKVTVWTWVPKAVSVALEGITERVGVVSVPDDLLRAFKQRNLLAAPSDQEQAEDEE